MRGNTAWMAIAIVLTGMVALVAADFSGSSGVGGLSLDKIGALVAMVAILLFWMGGGRLRRMRAEGGRSLGQIAIWLAIAAVTALVYQLWTGGALPGR